MIELTGKRQMAPAMTSGHRRTPARHARTPCSVRPARSVHTALAAWLIHFPRRELVSTIRRWWIDVQADG
jgi:hypothetical protein